MVFISCAWFEAGQVVDPYWWLGVGTDHEISEDPPWLLFQHTGGDPNSAFFRV